MRTRRSIFVTALALATLAVQSTRACSCLEMTDEARVNGAKRIVLARIVSTLHKPLAEEPRGFVEARNEVVEVLKGAPQPSTGTILEPVFGPGSCSVPLFTVHQYVLLLHGEEPEYVSMCSGAFIYVPGNEPSQAELAKV